MEIKMGVKRVVDYWHKGDKESERWYCNKQLHREGNPAVIEYYESGEIEIEYWYQNNQLHRENAPSVILYYKSGKKKRVFWYLNGKEIQDKELIVYKEWLKDNNLR